MALKESIEVTVSSTPVVTYDATSDFTTDVIEWVDFSGFALNAWFPVLNGTNPTPTLTVEVSNSIDLSSFKPLINKSNIELINLHLPRLWEIASVEAKYIRFIYISTDVGALSTVTFNFNKLIL